MLVGSSVDYLIHIIEGYLHSDPGDAPKEGNIRCFRLGRALASVGIPIISSGLTTMAAGIVLIFCQIQLLSKFGIIMVRPSLPPPHPRPLFSSDLRRQFHCFPCPLVDEKVHTRCCIVRLSHHSPPRYPSLLTPGACDGRRLVGS